jgi:DNA polymerase-1
MLGMDTETERFGPGNMAPRLVCMSLAIGDGADVLHHSDVTYDLLCELLEEEIVGHNIAYDAAVLCRHQPRITRALFEAYLAERIHDTMLREQLIANSQGMLMHGGGYSLAHLSHKYLKHALDKETYRLSYGELHDLSLDEWPPGAIEYAKEDARAPSKIYDAQGDVADGARQAAYSFAYRLMTCWGMITDAARVEALRVRTHADMGVLRRALIAAGLMKVKASGKNKGKVSRDLKAIRAAVQKAYGDRAPRTEKGNISTSRETVSAHPQLKTVADFVSLQKLDSTYIRVLEEGTRGTIHAEYHMLATGRRGANKNAQTLPKQGGVRECYRPRDGCVFANIDYDTVELRTWSQVMVNLFGIDRVPMALMYRDDPDADPHTKFGAEYFLNISYEEGLALKAAGDPAMKKARQASKAANFGFPGGLGAPRFVEYAFNNYGYEISEREAKRMKSAWASTWGAQRYFDWVGHQEKKGWVEQHWSKRIRGGLKYCDLSNTMFQGLAADGSALSLFILSMVCYAVEDAVLYGSRPVGFSHDEALIEVPISVASRCLKDAEKIMVTGMQQVCPDVPIRVSGVLTDRYTKDAPRIVDLDGEVLVHHVAA